MPTYQTHCQACQKTMDRRLSYQEYDAVKDGSLPLPCSCGGQASLEFVPSAVSFVLKDSQIGGWVTKAGKENAYRAKRRQVMAQRERDHVRPNTLQPNYQGESVGSWSEARDAAYQSTYQKAKSEHGAITAAKVATESAKTYEPYVKREISS